MKMTDYDKQRLKRVWAPRVTGVPPCMQVGKDMMLLPDGEIRHYGIDLQSSGMSFCYLSSRDNGLSWKQYPVPAGHPGAAFQSPWSGKWISFAWIHNGMVHDVGAAAMKALGYENGICIFESENGPDGNYTCRMLYDGCGWTFRPPLALRSRKRWILPAMYRIDWVSSCPVIIFYSDDDGASWEQALVPQVSAHKAEYPHKGARWENSGVEAAVTELKDGSLYMLLRTSHDRHYESRSFDGGETWSEPVPSRFYATLTMPELLRLKDGRLMAIWNNTTPLPELDHYDQQGLTDSEIRGWSEDVFTNRDVLHAAISDNDGKTWKGFREILLDDIRNAGDFRRHGGFSALCVDKSIHQTQTIEVDEGKILVAAGQHPACAKMLLMDPDWLCENERSDDFSAGTINWSLQQYLKSPSGGFRGSGGHCSWNRRAGAALVPDPECCSNEVLQIARHPDARLIYEKEGAVWNFPMGKKGCIRLELYQVYGSAGLQLALLDRWVNPVDPVVPLYSQFVFNLNSCGRWNGMTGKGWNLNSWHEVQIDFDLDKEVALMSFPGSELEPVKVELLNKADDGVSYIHLQSAADTADTGGVLLRSISAVTEL